MVKPPCLLLGPMMMGQQVALHPRDVASPLPCAHGTLQPSVLDGAARGGRRLEGQETSDVGLRGGEGHSAPGRPRLLVCVVLLPSTLPSAQCCERHSGLVGGRRPVPSQLPLWASSSTMGWNQSPSALRALQS